MKILFVSAYNAISGGTIMLFEHAYKLQQNGHTVSITFKDVNKEIPFNVFPHSSEINIVEFKSGSEYDIVVATYWTTVYLLHNFDAKHYVYFSQCDERLFFEPNDPTRFWVEQTLTIINLPIVASAQFLADRYKQEFNADSYYLPYGLNLDMFNPIGRTENNKIRVLIEGAGKAKIKRVADAFEAVKGIHNIEVWYVTYDGYVNPDWKPDNIFKSVPYSEMPNIYRSCDILLKLSEVESFGLPNLEMMACGGAIITSDFTGHEEYAVDGENSFVVHVGDIAKTRERLIFLIENPEVLSKFKSEGYRTSLRRNWNTITPDFNTIITQILEKYEYGNKAQCLSRLTNMNLGFMERQNAIANRVYLESWRDSIAKREKHFAYRIASKIHRLTEK